jgi:TRAP-type C4-dicarboxylate transport system permease small subunit
MKGAAAAGADRAAPQRGAFSRLEAAFDALLLALAWFAAAVFAAVALLIPVNVALRNAADLAIYGLLDAVEYGMLAATFLAAPWVLSINAHVSVDLVTGALGGRARRAVEAAAHLAGAAVCALFLWAALEALAQSAARGAMIRTAFTLPEWWALAIPPTAFALMLLDFLRKLARGAGPRSAAGL